MDKNTLSSYGWIVVLVLILSVLLALCTPLGNFVADGIRAFTGGFIDTNNAALEQVDPNAGKIPADQCSHENIELKFQKSATCSANGYTGDEVCKDCNTTIKTGTVVNKTAHTAVTDPAVAATCEQKGKTEGSHCSVCNTKLVAQKDVDALGHDWGDPFVAEQATCVGNGISRIECKREGCDAHTDTTITAKGHTIVTMKGKTATCTATGLTDGEKCSTCGTVTKAQTTIKALGHTAVTDKAVSATCTTDGKTEGSHCSVCNTVIKAQSTVSALGHQMGDPVVTLNATCESAGQTKTSCKRTGCGHYEVGNIPATGHNIVKDNAVAATCTATGLTAGEHCTKCNYKVAQTTIPALGHDMGEAVTTLNATCTTAGETKTSCKRCSYYETGTIKVLGHTEVTDKAVAATCTKTGLTSGTHCSVCGTVTKAQETVKALGHEYSDYYTVTEMTCTVDGVQRKDCKRDGCDHYETLTTTAPGHKEVTDKAIAPTCTATGLTAGTHCSVCNKVLTAQTVVSALGHKEVTDNAIPATCLNTGKTEGKHCSVCGTVTKAQTTVKALGHDIVKDNAVAATCTKTGLTEGEHCSRCDYKIAQTTTAALGHEYNSTVTKVATCKEDGIITYTCIRNDHSYTVATSALGHIDVNPADNNCDRCGNIIKEVPGLGDVEVDNPDIEITYDPDTGDAGGIVPPSDDGDDEPFDIPEEDMPETVTVNYGKFESNTEYTPGQYATVEYIENVITVKQPVNNSTYSMAWWTITKDGDGNIISTVSESPMLSNLPNEYKGTKFSNYIVYSFDDTIKLEMNDVKSNTIWFATVKNETEDTLENAIYLAAVAQRQRGFDVHIAKWNGTQYVDQGKDAEVDGVTTFTTSTPITKTKQVLISAPTSTTTYTYVPVGTLVAEKDMTWAEWLVSDYNTTGETAPIIKTADFEDVSYDDVIIAGESYGFMSYTLSGTWQFNETLTHTGWASGETKHETISFILSYKTTYDNSTYSAEKTIMTFGQRSTMGRYCEYFAMHNDEASNGHIYAQYHYSGNCEAITEADKWWNDAATNPIVDFGTEPQTVSKEFYEWFTANAKPCLSGTWKLNESLTRAPQEFDENISFTIENRNITYINIKVFEQTGIIAPGLDYDMWLQFWHANSTVASVYKTEMGWMDREAMIITFTSSQTVSQEFYEWFIANATQQKAELAPGLYETGTSNLIYSWDDLLNNNFFKVTNGTLYEGGSDYSKKTLLNGNLVLPNDGTITAIGDYALIGTTITGIQIPETVTIIGNGAFASCTSLSSIIIPDSVSSVGDSAFLQCRNLSDVKLGKNVKYISRAMFSQCTSLTNIDFVNNATQIGFDAFESCTGLVDITIPASIKHILPGAFNGCSNLSTMTFEVKTGWTENADPIEIDINDPSAVAKHFTNGTTVSWARN